MDGISTGFVCHGNNGCYIIRFLSVLDNNDWYNNQFCLSRTILVGMSSVRFCLSRQ